MRGCPQPVRQRTPDRCYHHNGMKPHTLGRVVGIGLRVVGRVAGSRITGEHHRVAQPAQPAIQSIQSTARTDAAQRGRATAQNARNVGRAAQMGAGGFFRSFRRAGAIVWLQVVGSFFFLPVLAFSPKLWQTRMSWQAGPDHKTFVATAIVVVVFSYLGATSFLRAGRR